jgi:ABC-type microcin C transport system duplicated ATPase subunit YejF
MVTSVLHDNLKRCVNIMPSKCVYGILQCGNDAEMVVTIKNEDSQSQRIVLKPISDKRIVVRQDPYGAIAPGMTKKLIVTIRCILDEENPSRIKEEL